MIIIALSNPARDNMHHQASAQILTGDAKNLQERRERERERESEARLVHFLRGARKNRGVYEVGGLPTKNVSGRGNDRGRRVAAEFIENRRIFQLF
jgi:hypothetical protein